MLKHKTDTARTSSPSNYSLVWEHISINIEKMTNKRVLDNVSGYARSGRLLAFLGPSTSGKSTLITLLSDRPIDRALELDTNNGRIYLNGLKVNDCRILLEHCGYVEQPSELGEFIGSITVREHLIFQVFHQVYTFYKGSHFIDILGYVANIVEYE